MFIIFDFLWEWIILFDFFFLKWLFDLFFIFFGKRYIKWWRIFFLFGNSGLVFWWIVEGVCVNIDKECCLFCILWFLEIFFEVVFWFFKGIGLLMVMFCFELLEFFFLLIFRVLFLVIRLFLCFEWGILVFKLLILGIFLIMLNIFFMRLVFFNGVRCFCLLFVDLMEFFESFFILLLLCLMNFKVFKLKFFGWLLLFLKIWFVEGG